MTTDTVNPARVPCVPRYVRKARRIYDFSCCQACGTGWGGSPGAAIANGATCRTTTCLACGTPQCECNGLSRGQCAVCYFGLLPGWSGSAKPCGYKGCTGRAVARIGGRPDYVCASHLERRKPGSVAKYLADRDALWELFPAPIGGGK